MNNYAYTKSMLTDITKIRYAGFWNTLNITVMTYTVQGDDKWVGRGGEGGGAGGKVYVASRHSWLSCGPSGWQKQSVSLHHNMGYG